MTLKERSSRTVREEVYEFDEELGYWETDTWTRRTVNGELTDWIPHDGYGPMPQSSSDSDVIEKLESLYQQSTYSSDVS